MAASKLLFERGPVQPAYSGWTLHNDYLDTRGGLRVYAADANGNVVPNTAGTVTVAIGTNPGGGTLSGTLTVPFNASGVAPFADLSIDKPGTGYTLSFTSSGLTTVVSPTFNILSAARVNNVLLSGTISAAGLGTAVGPYRFRGGATVKGVAVSATSTQAADAVQIYVTEPGVALSTASGEKLVLASGTAMGIDTCPFYHTLDSDELGGMCDIYVAGTTVTGVVTVNIRRMENPRS